MRWVNPILFLPPLRRLRLALFPQKIFPPFLPKISPTPLLFRFSSLAPSPPPLLVRFTAAIDDRRLNDAWAFYERSLLLADDHKDDAPTRRSLLRKLLVALTETSDPEWLCRGFHAVESEIHRHHGIDGDSLLYLSLALAGNGLHVPASTALRRMTEIGNHPHVAVWSAVASRIVVASGTAGAFLAAELLLIFGTFFQDSILDKKEEKIDSSLLAMRPDPLAFEIALLGCLASGLEKKAEDLLDLMPRVGVNPNSDLLLAVAHVYERNARLDEIKKLESLVIGNPDVNSSRIPEFYDLLLSCQLKLNDLDSATEIVLDILEKRLEIPEPMSMDPSQSANPILTVQQSSFEEFCKDRDSNFTRLASETRELVLHMRRKLQGRVELVKSDHGILKPSVRVYGRLVRAFVEGGKVTELASFLIKASEEEGPASLAAQAINACISLRMLEQSHDLIDEMRFRGFRVGSSVYSNLVEAYWREGKIREATALVKEARRIGVQLHSRRHEVLAQSQDRVCGKLLLLDQVRDLENGRLLEEIKDFDGVDCGVHQWNNVIHFFCKKRLMKDAQKALRKMRESGHMPNSRTFCSLVTAYDAIGEKCVEVAEVWGEMKVLVRTSQLELDQELLDSLLSCFIRVGLFLRANEVVKFMEEAGMFVDKFKYRSLWLKYRRTFYGGKQAEAQVERREAALVFKRWLGLA